jgi:YD repeat-containing protein
VLVLLAVAEVSAAADAPPAITAHRRAARPGDGPAMQDGADAVREVLPAEGSGLPDRALGVKAAERSEKGSGRYFIVLWEAGTPVPGDAAKKIMKKVAEPDIPKLGGKVLFSRGSQRVIELPLKEVKKLRRHEAVVSLQRLWAGESRSEWAEPPDSDPVAESEANPANSRLAVKTDVDTNLDWGPLTYGYDGSGNIKQTSTTANTDSYVYDSAGRLIQATVKGQTETYAYDAFGNMTAKGITGGVSTTIPVDGSSNRLIGPSYDAAGNVLSRDGKEAYEYDSFNMLSKYRRPDLSFYTLEMVYDPDDERLGVLLPGDGSRWSVRELGGQVIREYDGIRDGNNLFLMWQADYIRGEGGQLLAGETPVWQYNDQNGGGTTTAVYGGLRHYHLDHLGSVRLVTDASKRTLGEHDYFPYGVTPTKAYQEELNPGTPHIDPMRYAGHQRDFLGYLNVENTGDRSIIADCSSSGDGGGAYTSAKAQRGLDQSRTPMGNWVKRMV